MKIREISIVIPYYNNIEGLKRLLDSIPDKDSIEVIVVDDKSDNYIGVKTLVDGYKNTRYIANRSNSKGAGTSRNIGVVHACGRWLLFADTDDYFVPKAFEVIQKYLDIDEDIVYFVPTSIYDDTGQKARRHILYERLVDKYIDSGDKEIRYRYFVPWSKMIKRELVIKNRIKFAEIIAGNDMEFSMVVGHMAKKILAVRSTIYCCTKTRGSISEVKKIEYFYSKYDAKKRYNLFVKSLGYSRYQEPILMYIFEAKTYGWCHMWYVLKDIFSLKYKVFPSSYCRYLLNPRELVERLADKRRDKKYNTR